MARVIDIPGGTATILDSPSEWTPRRKKPVELIAGRLGNVMRQIGTARRILVEGDLLDDRSAQRGEDGELLFTGPDLDLTERQYELMSRLNDATCWAMLLGWSLPLPLPASPEALLDDCPGDVYDALRVQTSKRIVGDPGAGFEPDAGVEDPDSPTGP